MYNKKNIILELDNLKDYAIITDNKYLLQSVLNIAYELGLIKKKCEV